MALYRIDMIIEGKAPDKIKHGDIREKLEQVKKLAKRLPGHGAYATEVKGLKGAIYKRIAETHFRCIPRQRIDKAPDQMQKDKEPRPECYQALIESQKYYWQAVRDNFHMSKEEQQIKVSRHWALVQYLCLGAVLGGKLRPEHWYAAKASADFDAKFPDPQSQIEAHSSLAELYLLLLAYAAEEGPRSGWKLLPPKTKPAAIKQQAAKHVRAIVELASDEGASFIAYATRRQLRRYVDWWGKPEFVKLLPEKDKAGRKDWSDPKDENAPVAVAQHLLGLLPDDDEA